MVLRIKTKPVLQEVYSGPGPQVLDPQVAVCLEEEVLRPVKRARRLLPGLERVAASLEQLLLHLRLSMCMMLCLRLHPLHERVRAREWWCWKRTRALTLGIREHRAHTHPVQVQV